MGTDKANLPFGPERMLQRMVRIVSESVAAENIAVVASQGQVLPPLPERVIVTHDRQPERGPLEGLACGLIALDSDVEAIYLTGCDTPLLVPGWIDHLFSQLHHNDIVVPQDGDFLHPLSAVFQRSLLPNIEAAISQRQLALHKFIAARKAKHVSVEQLREVDPELLSLRNLNTVEDYDSALKLSGFNC